MKTEYKTKWLEALRSGKYQQTDGKLRTEDGSAHCCLGVLCDIVAPKLWWGEDHDHTSGLISHYVLKETETEESYCKAAQNPRIPFDYLKEDKRIDLLKNRISLNTISLAELNDNGFSFLEIADLIEKHIPAE